MRTHHWEKMPIAMAGLTDVLMPTERKVEYCRMIGVLNFSKPALGQRYHCEDRRQSIPPPSLVYV